MKSPLSIYKEVAKEFNVTGEKELHPRQKLAFATEQANQQRAIINRLVFDISQTRIQLEDAKDDATKSAYRKKMEGYQDDLRQLTRTLDFSIEMEKELRDENPGLEATGADHPNAI